MEKISGIIPSSPRVTKVDLSDAPASRAFMPNSERVVVTTLSENTPGTPAWKNKESRQAALAAEVSNSFFMKAKPDVESESPSGKQTDGGRLQQPEGLYPKGSFIDRSA
jgi:hypothetical protein